MNNDIFNEVVEALENVSDTTDTAQDIVDALLHTQCVSELLGAIVVHLNRSDDDQKCRIADVLALAQYNVEAIETE